MTSALSLVKKGTMYGKYKGRRGRNNKILWLPVPINLLPILITLTGRMPSGR